MRNRRAQTNATELRKQMTDAERQLWQSLRRRQLHGHKFRRQYPIGPYVADFACIEAGLVIEVDGGQHNEQKAQDALRTEFPQGHGFRVLRFWNDQVLKETDAVLEIIAGNLPPP